MFEMDFGILFILGISVFGGLLGARIFQKLQIPQVVGYIAIGVIVGQSGLQLIKHSDIQALYPFNLFALGIIGFLVGGELTLGTFRKYFRQFTAILIGEGVAAFLLVGVAVTVLVYLICHNFFTALAAGIVLGAIASATDPASTIDVLWEYRSLGVLTTSITAIVALDDALAMTLYGLGTSTAEMLTSTEGSILHESGKIAAGLFGALALGAVFALILIFLLRWFNQHERSLALSIGMILILIWICDRYDVDVILATMCLGFVVVNVAPRRSVELFKIMRGFSVPIYVLFFVLVGARLGIGNMPGWLWLIVGIYVVGRSAGKMAGAWLGAKLTGAEPSVRRYLGLGLFSQGGVAVGLSIMASQHLGKIRISPDLSLGEAIIFAVTATTLIVQIIGPPMVKLSVKLAGEIGRNITDEDVISSWTVNNVLIPEANPVSESLSLSEVIRKFSDNDYLVCPVVNANDKLTGVISMNTIKTLLVDRESWQWLVASDVMEPVSMDSIACSGKPLAEVIDFMQEVHLDQLPVIDSFENKHPMGMLDSLHIRKQVANEVLKRRQPVMA